MKEKTVSVIISNFNRKDMIEKCVPAMLRSNYRNFELVVVDGGSTDGALDFLQRAAKKNKKLKVFVDKTPGRNPARNTGIKNAKGEILIFVDSDCVVERNWMREIIKPFENKKVGGVIGRTKADKKGLFWYHMENSYVQYIGHNSAYRKEIVRRLGGFDVRFKTAKEDTDLAFRVLEAGYEIVYCPNAVMTHLSRRAAPQFRVKNQKHYVYDGLLMRKHPEFYRKLFFDKGMPSPMWPSVLAPLFIAVLALSALTSAGIFLGLLAVYVLLTARKAFSEKDGTIKEKLSFVLVIWLLPLSRLYYFTKGYCRFRRAKI